MGRRAKNKQGDPRPLNEFQEKRDRRDSSKKLGKRKAETTEEDVTSKRPAKKLKETEGKKPTTKTKEGKKVAFAKTSDSVNKSALVKDKKGKRKQESEDEDEDVMVEDGGSSEGWEDVDEDDLKTQRKYVQSSPIFIFYRPLCSVS